MAKKKKIPVKRLIKKLDTLVSEVIRKTYPFCVTCYRPLVYKKRQCGHYFSRIHYGTRWEYDNLATQDVVCNVFKRGNYPAFAEYMYNKLGKKRLDELKKLSKKPVGDLRKLIEEKTIEFTKRLKDLS